MYRTALGHTLTLTLSYYERSKLLLIDDDGEKSTQKNVHRHKKTSAVDLQSFNYSPIISVQLLAADSGVRLAYTDSSGERKQAPFTSRWDPSSLQRSFRQAIASSVHAATVGSAYPTQILPASDSEHRPRRSSGVRLAYIHPSGGRQRAPSSLRWGPSSLHRSFRRAIESSVHTCF